MTSASEIQPPLGLGSGIEALRAKRGWIIALGIIYVITGLIALGSVVMATVVSVFVVGIMMLIAGVAEVINAFQVKSWGKFPFLAPSQWAVHRCWLCHIRESAPGCGALDPLARGRPRRLRHHADHPSLQHEGGDAADLGDLVQHNHARSRPRHPCALAGFEPLYSRAFPRDRSHLGGHWLDQRRFGPENPSLGIVYALQ
jgi:hypothetical protein